MNLRMTPLDFDPRTRAPLDERLYDAAQEYCLREFGKQQDFLCYIRSWVVERVDGETLEVVGIATIWNAPDVPIFHVTPPTQDKEGLKVAEEVTTMMCSRLNSYIADCGNRGRRTLIFVDPGKERIWRRFLNRIGAQPANRWEIEIR